MKKNAALILCLCFLALSFSGCHGPAGPDRNSNVIWISDDPEISFIVFDEREESPSGEMNINGEIVEIDVLFDYGSGMFIFPFERESEGYSDEELLLQGTVQVRKDQLTFNITWRKDDIWEDIDTVTFYRETIDASEQPDAD